MVLLCSLQLVKSENKKELGCDISISQLKGKLWGSLNKLEIKVDSNTTLGHPTISSDEKVCYFLCRYERRLWRKRFMDGY